MPPFYGRNDHHIKKKILEGKCQFDSEIFDGVSDEVKNLIKKMLKYDINSRPTVE